MNTILVTTGFLQNFGGVQSVERLLHSTLMRLASESRRRHVTCSLRDAPDSLEREVAGGEVNGASASRLRLVGAVLWWAARLQPRAIVFSHVHLARMAPLLRLVCPRSRVAVVAHGIEVWRPLDVLTRLGIRCVSEVWCVSRYTARQLVRYNPMDSARLRLLPNAIDAPSGSSVQRSDAGLTLLSVCRLEHNERYKGVDLGLRAHALLLQEFPSLQYRVVGAGSDLERLKALVNQLGTSERVVFLGRLSDADLSREYERCTVFVLPSRKEGFGIVFLEAMARGKPVVALAAGGTPEVVVDDECGLLVPPNDLLGLYEALRRLVNEPALRDRLGANGKRRVESQFTTDQFRERVSRLLRGEAEAIGHASVRDGLACAG